jgi:anti-anti-sigma factor
MSNEQELAATPRVLFENIGQRSVLILGGALDVSCAADLRAQAIEAMAADKDVLVALEGASRMEASTLTVLISLRNSLSDLGRRLRLSAASREVQFYLETVGASALIDWEARPDA